jgi:hypothetical protein
MLGPFHGHGQGHDRVDLIGPAELVEPPAAPARLGNGLRHVAVEVRVAVVPQAALAMIADASRSLAGTMRLWLCGNSTRVGPMPSAFSRRASP